MYVIGFEKKCTLLSVGLLFNNILTAHWHNYTDIIVMRLFTYMYMYMYMYMCIWKIIMILPQPCE